MPRTLLERTEFYDIWRNFIDKGATEAVPESIKASWKRCREVGFDPQKEPPHPEPLSQNMILKRLDDHPGLHKILQYYQKSIEQYFDFIPLSMFFCDKEGRILFLSGHDQLLKMLEEGGGTEGSTINESAMGTTAPGISLIEQEPSIVCAEEHFSPIFHWCSCIAIPIFDQQHDLLGCLDFTTNVKYKEKFKYLVPVLYSMVNSIQLELFLKQKLKQFDLFSFYFDSTFDYSDSIMILMNRRHQVINFNRKASEFFKINPGDKENKHVSEVLGDKINFNVLLNKSSAEKFTDFYHCSSQIFAIRAMPIFDKSGKEIAYLLKLEKEKACVSVPAEFHSKLRYDFNKIVGQSSQILRVIEKAKKVAKTQSNVLIEGETGTGKELFAQAIHQESRFCRGRFVALNCAAIPHELIESELFGYERGAYTGAQREGNIGKFELADSGTIFLDEIQAMDTFAQMKILRVIEERHLTRIGGKSQIPLNIRIITASTKDLEAEVERGTFLAPLYFRISVVRLYLPGLKERQHDIPILVNHFVKQMNEKFNRSIQEVAPEVLKVLSQYSWPGNVRQLRNCIESAFNFCGEKDIVLRHVDLPGKSTEKSRTEAEKAKTIETITRNLMVESLNRFGNVSDAANSLGISVTTFYRKMRKFDLSKM